MVKRVKRVEEDELGLRKEGPERQVAWRGEAIFDRR